MQRDTSALKTSSYLDSNGVIISELGVQNIFKHLVAANWQDWMIFFSSMTGLDKSVFSQASPPWVPPPTATIPHSALTGLGSARWAPIPEQAGCQGLVSIPSSSSLPQRAEDIIISGINAFLAAEPGGASHFEL